MIVRRFAPVVLAVVAVGAVFLGASDGQGSLLMLVVPVAFVALAWARHSARGGGVELRWAARTAAPDVLPPAMLGAPSALPVSVAPRTSSSRWQVSGALARFESRQWLASPWFAAGVGFLVLQVVLFGWVWAADYDGAWREWFGLMPIAAHPMVGMAVVGAHHAVTRGRRDGTEELFGTCPVDETIRTSAQLRAGWVPAAVVAVFVVVGTALLASRNPQIYGGLDSRAVADVLAAIMLTLCGSALGVALARWAPWRLAPIVVVAALVPVIIGLGNIGDPHWSNARQLSTWPRYANHDALFTAPPVWRHLLWLVALGIAMVWVAYAHSRRSPSMILAGVAVALVVAASGIAETRPLSAATANRLASMVAAPERHQTCRSAAGVDVCVYKGYEGLLDQVIPHVAAVAAAAPAGFDGATMRQTFDGNLDVLGPEVADALEGRSSPVDGFVPLGFPNTDEAMNVVRFTIAFDIVGLPVRPRPNGAPTVVAGEARGVVALWLAARGLEPDDARRLASIHFNPDDHPDDPTPTALDLGMAWPDPCVGGSSPPVAWARQDLTAARALLGLPSSTVDELLMNDWGRFTDPATSTDDLLAAAGLEPVGPPDAVVALPFECEW